jgi:hypothetical protein
MDQTREQVIVELIYKQVGKSMTKEGIAEFTKNFDQTKKQFGELSSASIRNGEIALTGFKQVGGGMVQVMSGTVNGLGNLTNEVGVRFERMRQQFNYAYLSFLFFGMAMQRTAQTVMKTTTRAFMDVARSGSVAGDALIGLNAEFAYLKFSVGQAIGEALAPLLPIITSIVRGFSSFVREHPEETFFAIASVLAIGGAMSMMGQVGLFLQGLGQFKTSAEWKALTGPGGGLEKVKQGLGGMVILYATIKTVSDLVSKEPADLGDILWNSLSMGVGAYLMKGKSAGIIATGSIMLIMGVANAGKFISGSEIADFGDILKNSLVTGIGAGLVFGKAAGSVLGGTIVGLVAAGVVAISLVIDSESKKQARKDFQDINILARKQGVEFGDTEGMLNFIEQYKKQIAEARFKSLGLKGMVTTPEQELKKINETLFIQTRLYDQNLLTEQEYLATLTDISGIQFLTNEQMKELDERTAKSLLPNLRDGIKPEFKEIEFYSNELKNDIEQLNAPLSTDLLGSIKNIAIQFMNIVSDTNTIKQNLKDIVNTKYSVNRTVDEEGVKRLKDVGYSNADIINMALGEHAFGSTYIPEEGLHYLHRGERVMTAGQNNLNMGGINITINTTGGVNGNVLAQQIMSEIRRRSA